MKNLLIQWEAKDENPGDKLDGKFFKLERKTREENCI